MLFAATATLNPRPCAAEERKEEKGAEEQHTEKKAKTEAGSKTTAPEVDADAKEPLSRSQPKNVVEEGRIYFFYRSEATPKKAVALSSACGSTLPVTYWDVLCM